MVRLFREISGDGDPIVLLNGIMMTTSSWAQQTRDLSRTLRCVLHDFRGQLRSEKPPGPYSMWDHVDDLRELLDELEIERPHLVGTSYGGEVAMLFATRHPERVRSLSVIGCVSHVDEQLRAAVLRWADVARQEPERLWDVTVPYNYSQKFLDENPVFVEVSRQRVRTLPAEWFEALAVLCETFTTLEVPLSEIHAPTLVMCGTEDALKPPHFSREIAAGIAGAKLVMIEGAGHAVVIERAEEVNAQLVRFLAAVDGRTAGR